MAGRQKDPQLGWPRGVLHPGGGVCEGLRVTKPGWPFLREVLTQQPGSCCAGLRGSRGPSRRPVQSSCLYLVQCVTDWDRDRGHAMGTDREEGSCECPRQGGLSVRGTQSRAVRSAHVLPGLPKSGPRAPLVTTGVCFRAASVHSKRCRFPCTELQQNPRHTLTRRI